MLQWRLSDAACTGSDREKIIDAVKVELGVCKQVW